MKPIYDIAIEGEEVFIYDNEDNDIAEFNINDLLDWLCTQQGKRLSIEEFKSFEKQKRIDLGIKFNFHQKSNETFKRLANILRP